jgi:hypothetical protein
VVKVFCIVIRNAVNDLNPLKIPDYARRPA